MVAKGVNALVVFPDAGKAILPALRSSYKAGVVTVPYRVTPGGKAGVDYNVFVDTPFAQAGENWGRWILRVLPKGGNVLMLSGPKGNSQGIDENKGLHKILDPTHKYTFIGEQPFEVTNWDPALTQKVLSAAIAKYPKIDVIVSDFGPSLVGALPEFTKSGRTIPALATSDGNVLGCFWKKNVAKNPTFKLFTVSTQNDHARLAIDWAVALATGGKKPASTHFPSLVFEDSTTGKPNPVECKPNLPGDIYLSAEAAGGRPGKAGEEVGTPHRCARRPPAAARTPNRPSRVIERIHRQPAPADDRAGAAADAVDARHHQALRRVAALTDVSFDVLPGEVHALLGENGAGKSTLMNVASGATTPDGGTIVFDGERVESLTPALAQELGIAIVHQHPALLPGHDGGREHPGRRRRRASAAPRPGHATGDARRCSTTCTSPATSRTGSVAQRGPAPPARAGQGVRGLAAAADPRRADGAALAGLRRAAVQRVRRLAAEGTAVVYITHRLAEVREIADRVTVLRDGTLRGTSAVDDISDDELLALIVGRTLEATFPPKHAADRRRGAAAPASRAERARVRGHLVQRPRGRDRRASPASSATASPRCCARSPGLDAATGSVDVGGKELSRRALLRERGLPAGRPPPRA